MLFSKQKPQLDNLPNRLLPHGIKVIAYARSIRWVGWGLGEALIPVFIVAYSHTFAQMGLFSSTVEIIALISLPIIGVWADQMPAKYLVLTSLILYPLVGISYFLAGVFGAAVFLVIARAMNGFIWELENVGIETYYRRIASHAKIATSFGYLDTWSNAGWISAALIGMYLASFIPIYYLLLGISPFAMIAYLVALRAPKDSIEGHFKRKKWSFIRSYGTVITEWRTWNTQLRLLCAVILFSSVIICLTDFFIPIEAYFSGADLSMVVLLAILRAVPSLFGYQIGRLVDVQDKFALIALGLCVVAVAVVGITIFPQYWIKLLAIFIMGIIVELFNIIKNSLITILGPAVSYGIRGSVFESIATLGDLTAPLIVGVALDIFGFSKLLPIIASAAIGLSIVYYFRHPHKLRSKCL